MKILYAVQATGNGHISRAMELLPHLQRYGQVDIFLSGDNSNLLLDAPVKYRSRGISLFYNCNGGLDYWQMLKKYQPARVRQEIRDLPVDKYDMVLNDFEHITSAACARKKIPSVHFGHQASFQSPHTPRPAKQSLAGEWLLKNYVKATHHVGLHFTRYDDFIFPAIIKKEILEAEPADHGYVVVYLPSYCRPRLRAFLSPVRDVRFRIFTHEVKKPEQEGHLLFVPVNKQLFNTSLIHGTGIISGGGFETPAEALHMGKKIMAIPIRGQYEQRCNMEALKNLGVTCLLKPGEHFRELFYEWLTAPAPERIDYSGSIGSSLNHIFRLAESRCSLPAA